MSTIRRIAASLGIAAVLVALVATPSSAQVPQAQETGIIAKSKIASEVIAKSTISVAKSSSKGKWVAVTAYAQPGEGVIRIMTRVCGTASGWQNVASANNITPPVYLVLLGQQLTVQCPVGGHVPAPAPAPAAAQPAPQQAASGWANPAPGECVVSPRGWRWGRMHEGVDLASDWGDKVFAAAAGTATRHWQSGGAGNYVTINHGNGLYTHYFHLDSFIVGDGAWVSAGTAIGYAGSTGDSTGVHLHFEVRPNGAWGGSVDPQAFMQGHGIWLGC